MLTPQTPVIAERDLKKSSCNYVGPLEEQKSEGRIVPEAGNQKWPPKSTGKKLPALKAKSKSRKTSKKKKPKTGPAPKAKCKGHFFMFFRSAS